MKMHRLVLRGMRISSTYNLLVMCICVCLTLYAVFYFRVDKPKHPPPEVFLKTNKTYKMIHLHSFPWYYELQMGEKSFEGCPVSTCTYVDKPETIPNSDAILFFTDHQPGNAPPEKTPGQVWIFFSVESPIHSFNTGFGGPSWEGKFNWTMSYRLDSDIKFGYGDVVPGGITEAKDYVAIATRKKKLVAWFVSNCNTQSQRMKYVNMLQKYIPVDIYGHCGRLKCERDRSGECMEMLAQDYKFYLSFENSLCQDYVTEKLLKTLKTDIVPVARGGANYTALLPSKMAIITGDYTSVKDLAEYLKYLANNVDEYVSYLKWKDSYHIVEPQPFPHCLLCERVHQPLQWPKVYPNVADWWRRGRCSEANDIGA
ncbi:alpha-(1,3)-fucosyltransferase C-like [Haliotis rufescens]|uniref:alpha-(1,3)-fucosyltransferase C-like n=1 Tax=Haliotis rufescens TaxID=6454 RepID=UPI00201FB0A6|nr:alpha-(1,3)-fucosyltransferase C-like [Haliotis rufescens]